MPRGFQIAASSDAGSAAESESVTESVGGDIPAIEDAKAEEQVNGELKDDAEEAGVQSDDEPGDEEEEQDNEAEDEAPDGVYTIEAIRSHKFDKGQLKFWVKWKGYGEEENTLEPEANLLQGAAEILKAYYKKIGGKPVQSTKKRKSTTSMREAASETTPVPAKRPKRNGDTETVGTWVPKGQSWEDDISSIDTIERDLGTGKLWVYLNFRQNRKSKVGIDQCYKHCPLAMLKFYEAHLKFNE